MPGYTSFYGCHSGVWIWRERGTAEVNTHYISTAFRFFLFFTFVFFFWCPLLQKVGYHQGSLHPAGFSLKVLLPENLSFCQHYVHISPTPISARSSYPSACWTYSALKTSRATHSNSCASMWPTSRFSTTSTSTSSRGSSRSTWWRGCPWTWWSSLTTGPCWTCCCLGR